MAHLLTARLNIKKIPLDKYVKGEKGTYVDVTIGVADEPNNYNQTTSVWIAQSQEEREGKKPRTYLGNGIVIYTDGKPLPKFQKEDNKQETVDSNDKNVNDIDLPF